jgi:hypothetical protein
MDRIPNAPKAFYPIWAENALWTYRGRSASLAPRARPRHMGQRRYADTNTLWTHHAGRAGAHPYQPRAWPRHAVKRRTPTPTLRPGRFLRSKFAVDNRMIRATG